MTRIRSNQSSAPMNQGTTEMMLIESLGPVQESQGLSCRNGSTEEDTLTEIPENDK